MPALRLEGVTKVFPGGHEAVVGVDLSVAAGELVVLLGPSGCGKSTLLRIIAGIETPTSGRVLISGEDVTGLPPQGRDLAMVFQNYALYPHMNVRENLAFGLKMRGTDRAAIAQRVGEVAESLGITALLDRRPAQLSGGQRQRVALGRAIARQAKVFLLDEPLSNLDVQLRQATRTELAKLHRRLSAPMIYVTHDQEEAMTLGDRVVVMRAGRILQIGTPMEIYQRPATSFVGGFVGSPKMNFLPARLEPANGGGLRVSGAGMKLNLDAAAGAQGHVGDEILLGIRPEDLKLTGASDGDLTAGVDLIEPLGRETLLHLVTEEDGSQAPAELRVLVDAESAPDPAATVSLSVRRDRVHLFDRATERRIN